MSVVSATLAVRLPASRQLLAQSKNSRNSFPCHTSKNPPVRPLLAHIFQIKVARSIRVRALLGARQGIGTTATTFVLRILRLLYFFTSLPRYFAYLLSFRLLLYFCRFP